LQPVHRHASISIIRILIRMKSCQENLPYSLDSSTTGGLIDVKCLLSGPVSPVTVRANGFKLKDWELPSKTFPVAEPIEINIIGKFYPGHKTQHLNSKIVAQVVYYGINAIITKAFIRGH
jgi:hypothetical protein